MAEHKRSGPSLEATLSYAARGWAVLPIRFQEKVPWTETRYGLSWANGEHSATTNHDHIHETWRRWPLLNVGIALRPSGLVVLDLDSQDAEVWVQRMTGHGHGHESVMVRTGRGAHVYYRQPVDTASIPNLVPDAIAPGVQVKATGYVLAPPSVHPTGAQYLWWSGRDLAPLDAAPAEIPPVPDWLAEGVACARSRSRSVSAGSGRGQQYRTRTWKPPSPSRVVVARALEQLARSPEGRRNNVAHRVAHRIREAIDAGLYEPQHLLDLERGYWEAARRCGAAQGNEVASTAKTWVSVIERRACCHD